MGLDSSVVFTVGHEVSWGCMELEIFYINHEIWKATSYIV